MKRFLFALLALIGLVIYVGACDKSPQSPVQGVRRMEFHTKDNVHRGHKWVDENGMMLSTSFACDTQAEFRYALLNAVSGDTITLATGVTYYWIDNYDSEFTQYCVLVGVDVLGAAQNPTISCDSLVGTVQFQSVKIWNGMLKDVNLVGKTGSFPNSNSLEIGTTSSDPAGLVDVGLSYDASTGEGWTVWATLGQGGNSSMTLDGVTYFGKATGYAGSGGLLVRETQSGSPTCVLKNCGWLDVGSNCDLPINTSFEGTPIVVLDDTWKIRESGGTVKTYGFEPVGSFTNEELYDVSGLNCEATVRYKINFGSYQDNAPLTSTYILRGDNSCTTQQSATYQAGGWHVAKFGAVTADCDFYWKPFISLCDGYLYTEHDLSGSTCHIEQGGIDWACGVCQDP